jgi:hypothetical protein
MSAVFREVGSNLDPSMSFFTPKTIRTAIIGVTQRAGCSNGEALASPGSPPFQDSPPRFGGHPFQEPVSSLPFQITGLKCHFHKNLSDNSCSFMNESPFPHAFGGNPIFNRHHTPFQSGESVLSVLCTTQVILLGFGIPDLN